MAQKLHIPILTGNSYEISSLSLAISKGYGFRFNNLPQGHCRSSQRQKQYYNDYLIRKISLYGPLKEVIELLERLQILKNANGSALGI